MKCPACPDTTLVMTDRQGVEIDYCPACRGIWLDRGELDKLLDRAAVASHPRQQPLRRRQGVANSPTLKTLTTGTGSATRTAARSRGSVSFLIKP